MYFNNKLMLFGFETILYFTLFYYIRCIGFETIYIIINFNVTEIFMMMMYQLHLDLLTIIYCYVIYYFLLFLLFYYNTLRCF